MESREPTSSQHAAPAPRGTRLVAPESFGSLLLNGLVFLFIGFVTNPSGVSDSGFLNGSIDAFKWGMRICGIALLLGAALVAVRARIAALFVLVVDSVICLGGIVIGVIWLSYPEARWFGILPLLIGVGAIGFVRRLFRKPSAQEPVH